MQAFIQSLLEHQKSRTPWSAATIELQGDCYLASIGAHAHAVKLSLPKSIGVAVSDFIKKHTRGGLFQKKIEHNDEPYLLRADKGRLELSAIPQTLSDPKKLVTPEQKKKIKEMLDHRSGIMLLSAPTAGATLAALDGIGHLVKKIDKKQKVSVLLLNESTAHAQLNATVATGPTFLLLLSPPVFSKALWRTIEQAALAGTMIVLGLPSNTPTTAVGLREGVDPMMRGPLLRGLVNIVPFVSACPTCSKAVDLHPDVPAYLSSFDKNNFLKGLKGAHAPGCNSCNFTGAGNALATMSLFSESELEDNLDQAHQEAIVADLLSRSHKTPVPLRHATTLWRSRPR